MSSITSFSAPVIYTTTYVCITRSCSSISLTFAPCSLPSFYFPFPNFAPCSSPSILLLTLSLTLVLLHLAPPLQYCSQRCLPPLSNYCTFTFAPCSSPSILLLPLLLTQCCLPLFSNYCTFTFAPCPAHHPNL